jgi:hypothetical protein
MSAKKVGGLRFANPPYGTEGCLTVESNYVGEAAPASEVGDAQIVGSAAAAHVNFRGCGAYPVAVGVEGAEAA